MLEFIELFTFKKSVRHTVESTLKYVDYSTFDFQLLSTSKSLTPVYHTHRYINWNDYIFFHLK